MIQTDQILCGELERLFDVNQMKELSQELLGIPPTKLGEPSSEAACARVLVEVCHSEHSIDALVDAIRFSSSDASPKLDRVLRGPSADVEIGSTIGDYRVVKRLGEGTVGVVYLGEASEGENGSSQRVAIKVLQSKFTGDRGALRRYLTTARAVGRIDSPNLVAITGAGVLEDGRGWVASEFVEGQTLSHRLERIGAMQPAEVLPVIEGVLNALKTLHAQGVTHGQVSGDNIFVVRGEDGVHGVLADPGTYRLRGSVSLSCPEGLRGEALSPASDIYGVGVAAYSALTGKASKAHLTGNVAAPSEAAGVGVGAALDAFVLKALSADPDERFTDALDALNALEAARDGGKEPSKDLDEGAFSSAVDAFKGDASEENASALEAVAAAAGAWEKLIASLLEVAEGLDEKQAERKVDIRMRVARIQTAHLKDHTTAAATYQAILEADSANDVARSALEELRRSSGDPDLLVEHLIGKAEVSESAEETAAIFREVAAIFEEQGATENAFQAWLQALAFDSKDARTIREIERLGSTEEQWNEALGVLSEAVQQEDIDPADAVPMYVLMGGWYASKLQRPDFAVTCYGQALQEDPANDAAYDGTLHLYKKSQSWNEYGALLMQRAHNATNPARARGWRVDAAAVMESKLDQQAEAQKLLEQVLEEDAGHGGASDALELIYSKQAAWGPLTQLLERRMHDETGASKADTLVRIAELYEGQLDDAEKAAVQFAAALSIDAQSLDALRGLERSYKRRGQSEELLNNLQSQLELVPTPRQRIDLLVHVGTLYEEEFVDREQARAAYERIIDIDAAHPGANSALARIYRHLERMDDLVETLQRHAKGCEDASERIALYLRAAKTLLSDMGAPNRAAEMCERILALEPEHPEALEMRARLKASAGELDAALESVALLSRTKTDPAEKAALLLRAGAMFYESGDLDSAIEQYKEALDVDSENREASAKLRSIYAARGDAAGASELLLRELEQAEGDSRKAALHAELGALKAERLDDAAGARAAYRKALELDPTCTAASVGLGDMAHAAGDHAGAVGFYEPLLARTSSLQPEVAKEICLRCGAAFRKMKDFGKAQRAFVNARAIAPDDRLVARNLAEVTYESGAYDEAAELFGSLLEKFADDLVGADKGEVLFRQGDAYRLSEVYDQAEKSLRLAAKLLPQSGEVFNSLRQLKEAQEDWDGAIEVIQSRISDAGDEERFDLLAARGAIELQNKGDREAAGRTYVSALELRPDDRNLLTKLMSVYSASKDWARLVEVILRIAELVSDPTQLAKYYITAGSITSRELGRLGEAAEYYEQAVEHDATLPKGFEGLVRCLKQKADWERLEDAYREHILRIDKTGTPEEKVEVWDELGDLLQNRLDRKTDAIEAFEAAQELDPENRRRTELLAEVYTADPKKHYTKAVVTHGQLLRLDPYRAESYQSLRALYTGMKRADESWCLCQALRALKMAGAEEDKFFQKHRSTTAAESAEFFSEEHWFNHVLHPEQDALLTGIFATISGTIASDRAHDLGYYKLGASDQRDAATDSTAVLQTLHYVAGVSQIELPSIYVREQDSGGLSTLFTEAPAIGVGRAAIKGGPPQALAFLAGRHLSYFRKGHLTRWLVSTGSALRAWLLAAIKLAVPQFPVPPAIGTQVNQCLQTLKAGLHGRELDQLHSLVQKLLSAAPELDMKRWMAAVDLTADRVGFIFSNDLETASAVIKASPEDASVVPQKERLKELYLYSVSEQYLELRQKLGISIDG